MNFIKREKTALASISWLMFAKIVGLIFSITLPLIVVRYLTQDNIGVYQQVFKVLGNTCAILTLGFSMSAYYYLAREEEKKPFAIFNIIVFNFVMGGIAFFVFYFYPQLLGNYFDNPEVTRLLPKLGIVVWIWMLSNILETIVLANRESKVATFFIIIGQLIKSLLMILAVIYYQDVDSLIYAALIYGLTQLALVFYYLNNRFPTFWHSFDFKFFVEHAKYALPFGISSLVWVLQIDIHNYFVSSRFTSAEFAIYNVGCFQLPLIVIIAESVTSFLIPKMSELQLQDKKREMIEITARAMQKLAFFYFPTFIFLMIVSHTFITTLYTEKFSASVPIFMVNLLLLPVYIWVTDPIARAYKEIGRFLFIYRLIFFIFIVLTLWFAIQHFTLVGMIATVVVINIIEYMIASLVVFKKIGVKFSDIHLLKNVGKTALISLFAGIFTFFVYANTKVFLPVWDEKLAEFMKPAFAHFFAGCFVLGISAVVFGTIYLVCANYFNLIDESEKNAVKSMFNKLTKRSGQTAIANP